MNLKQGITVVILLVVVVGTIIFLTRFSDTRLTAPEDGPQIAATIYPLYDIVRNIVGDSQEVALILPPGGSPHFYEFSPSQLATLQQTQIVFAIGHGIDDWLGTIVNALPEAEIKNVDDGIGLRTTADGNTDPHYWLHLGNAKTIAENIALRLGKEYPELNETYQNNLNQYISKLDIAEEVLKAELASYVGAKIITLHDAWEYFAENFGLEILGTFEPSAGEGPTPQYLIDLQEVILQNDIELIFTEAQFSNTSLENFASDNNLQIAPLDPIGGILGRETFIELMTYNVNGIIQALEK